MKKFVIILLVVCLILGGVVGYVVGKNGGMSIAEAPAPTAATAEEPTEAPTEAPTETPTGETDAAPAPAAPAELRTIDFEAIRALHDPDEVVGDVDGRAVTWGDYLYWLRSAGVQAESYLASLAMYGQSLDWDDKISADSEQSFAEYVVELAQDYVRQLCTLENFAEENGVELSEEDEAALAEQLAQDIVSECGEGASEEEFFAKLAESWLSREMYERLNRFEPLYRASFAALYGENGEKVSEEDAIAYLKDGSYLCASHILFMTVDGSFEPLDEETVQKKLADAEAVSAELRAIEDPAARARRFAELKEQYCEDTGREVYPDGYLFPEGTMVPEFEEGVHALADYEVSEPILSGYGYHVIMRLPLSAEMEVFNAGADARRLYASEQFSARFGSSFEQSVLTLSDEVAAFKLTDYLK